LLFFASLLPDIDEATFPNFIGSLLHEIENHEHKQPGFKYDAVNKLRRRFEAAVFQNAAPPGWSHERIVYGQPGPWIRPAYYVFLYRLSLF